MISGKTITLLVGGSIAAYKSAELVRELIRAGARVQVVMSKAACEFISPLTLQTLSGNRVSVDLFDEQSEAEIGHIKLADTADLLLVAPATADLIAKFAAGIADDALTTVLLATKAPVLIAPAMNVNMWLNPLTKRNVETLKSFGHSFVEPEEGDLACGWTGPGRLAEITAVFDAIRYVLSPKDLKGSHVIVTAGPTRESIDPIRFVSNRSSGKMGFAIARLAHYRGAKVSLVSGPTKQKAPEGIKVYPVVTAREMRDKVFELLQPESSASGPASKGSAQFVFMAAAVTDHSPASPSGVKVSKDKSSSYMLEMQPSPDILFELGEAREQLEGRIGRKLKIVGFSAETGDDEVVVAAAVEKLKRKKADLMVGNSAEFFERDTNRVWLLDRQGRQEEVATADKETIAAKIINAALRV